MFLMILEWLIKLNWSFPSPWIFKNILQSNTAPDAIGELLWSCLALSYSCFKAPQALCVSHLSRTSWTGISGFLCFSSSYRVFLLCKEKNMSKLSWQLFLVQLMERHASPVLCLLASTAQFFLPKNGVQSHLGPLRLSDTAQWI